MTSSIPLNVCYGVKLVDVGNELDLRIFCEGECSSDFYIFFIPLRTDLICSLIFLVEVDAGSFSISLKIIKKSLYLSD